MRGTREKNNNNKKTEKIIIKTEQKSKWREISCSMKFGTDSCIIVDIYIFLCYWVEKERYYKPMFVI